MTRRLRILVAGTFEAGSHWAHAINTVKTAQGFADLGHEVTVFCARPKTGRVPVAELRRAYGLRRRLRWVQAPAEAWRLRLDRPWPSGVMGAAVALATRADLVFARHYTLPGLTARGGVPTVIESHAYPDDASPEFRRLLAAARLPALRAWVTISERLVAAYRERGVPAEKLVVVPDAVDLPLFLRPDRLPPSPYPAGRPVVSYVGSLHKAYKGIPEILGAAKRLPEVAFHLVGGAPEDVAWERAEIARLGLANVTAHGMVPHADVPAWLWHADCLLMPPSAHHPTAAWTSPVKLGEYLAAGAPVVATTIPALLDWLTEDEACLTPPDDADALADAVGRVLDTPEYARTLTRNGLRLARTLSYGARAKAILRKAEGEPQ